MSIYTKIKNLVRDIYVRLTDKDITVPISGIKDFCEKNGMLYEMLSPDRDVAELFPPIYGERESAQICMRRLPETYLAELTNAIAFGENDVVLCRNTALMDFFSHPDCENFNLEKRIIKKMDWTVNRARLVFHFYRRPPIKEAFNLVEAFPFNYYHMLIDILPKFYYLSQSEKYKNIPLLIDKRTYVIYKPLIDFFNVENRKLILVGQDIAIKVRKMVVASNCAWHDKYATDELLMRNGHIYDNNALAFLRDNALSMVNTDLPRRRIFISRRNVPENRRRLLNEEDVQLVLEKYGFETVCPEELSFWEQVELFANTDTFVAVGGAACTNMIFLPRDARVLFFCGVKNQTGENLFPSMWYSINHGEGDFLLMTGETTPMADELKNNLRPVVINIEELEDVMKTWGY